MEKSTIVLAVLSMLAVKTAQAQIDSTIRTDAPVSDTLSPANRSASQEPVFFKEDRVEMDKSQLPANLRKTLTEADEYQGWENSTIYFDRSLRQYVLHLSDATMTRTYYFDENGQPVSEDEPRDDQ